MSTANRLIVGALAVAILIELALTVFWYQDPHHLASVKIDPAAALVVITAASVAIERAIEYFWTAVGMKWGSFWPLSAISAYANSLTDQLSTSIDPFIIHAKAAVTCLQNAGTLAASDAKKLGEFLNTTDDQLQALKKSAIGSQRMASYGSAASAAINSISAQYQGVLATVATSTSADKLALAQSIVKARATLEARRENPSKLKDPELDTWAQTQGDAAVVTWTASLPASSAARDTEVGAYISATGFGQVRTAGEVAGTVLSGLGDFLGTFTDNPGRRLLSIQIGVFVGILVAAIGGLDVVAGVQNQDVTDPLKLVPMTIGGVIFTGLMMGLGSSPTHEVIQTLQQYKRQRKAASAPTGTVSEEGAGSGSVTPLGELGAVTPLLYSELGARSRVRFDAAPEDVANSQIKIESPVRLRFR